jgi:hypothetical protein
MRALRRDVRHRRRNAWSRLGDISRRGDDAVRFDSGVLKGNDAPKFVSVD